MSLSSQRIISAVAPLDDRLAEAAGNAAMGWTNIKEVLASHQRVAVKQCAKDAHWTAYIPSVKDFTTTKLLGKGGFGVVYHGVSS